MRIHIKNFRTDKPTHGAIGYNCARTHTRRAQLMGLRFAKLGSQYPLENYARCESIRLCWKDEEWLASLEDFIGREKERMRYRHDIDLWCWCAPLSCHCEMIKNRIELEYYEV